jgi:uncharacterized protein HemY
MTSAVDPFDPIHVAEQAARDWAGQPRLDRHTTGLLVCARIAESMGDRDSHDWWMRAALFRLHDLGHDWHHARQIVLRHRADVDQCAGDELEAAQEWLDSLGEVDEPQYGGAS